jgi:hypothetical protein
MRPAGQNRLSLFLGLLSATMMDVPASTIMREGARRAFTLAFDVNVAAVEDAGCRSASPPRRLAPHCA